MVGCALLALWPRASILLCLGGTRIHVSQSRGVRVSIGFARGTLVRVLVSGEAAGVRVLGPVGEELATIRSSPAEHAFRASTPGDYTLELDTPEESTGALRVAVVPISPFLLWLCEWAGLGVLAGMLLLALGAWRGRAGRDRGAAGG